jgi:hypothetical protein
VTMKVVLVDCLIYQGLLHYRRRRAVASSDRDEPITTRMKTAHWRRGRRRIYGRHPALGAEGRF